MIYNDNGYGVLRETVSEGVYGKQIEKLVEVTKVMVDECHSIY